MPGRQGEPYRDRTEINDIMAVSEVSLAGKRYGIIGQCQLTYCQTESSFAVAYRIAVCSQTGDCRLRPVYGGIL